MEYRKLDWKIVAAFAACIVLGVMLFSIPQPISVQANEDVVMNTITVSGEGEIEVEPDVAYVRLGVDTEGTTAKEAQEKNAQIMTKIRKALTEKGVEDKDVQTVQFSTYPEYEWLKEKRELKGYRVSHILKVTYRDLGQIGKLLDDVASAGANRMDQVQFGTEKTELYEMDALAKALEQAEKKAKLLAEKSGRKVKSVVYIRESGVSVPPVYKNYAMGESSEKSMAANSTQISEGMVKVRKTVQVVYEF